MAQLPHDLDRFLQEVPSAPRGFLLRLSDQERSPAAVVDGLVLDLVSCADRIVFPGYREAWLRRASSPPAWALALDQRLSAGAGELSAADASATAVHGFWQSRDFVERPAPGRVESYRAAFPVLVLKPSRLAALPFWRDSTGFVGVLSGVDGGPNSLYRKAMDYAHRTAAVDEGSAFVIYQNPEWLHFMGSQGAMRSTLEVIAENLRTGRGTGDN